jgi:hypothetical protein
VAALARAAGTSVTMLDEVYDIQRQLRQPAEGAQIYQGLLPLPDAAAAEEDESDADAEIVAQGAAQAAPPPPGALIPTGVLAPSTALALVATSALAPVAAAILPAVTRGRLSIASGTGVAQHAALMTRVRAREHGAWPISDIISFLSSSAAPTSSHASPRATQIRHHHARPRRRSGTRPRLWRCRARCRSRRRR